MVEVVWSNILNAADYGVPQFRNRVFFIGNRLGIDNIFSEKTHFNPDKLQDWQNKYSGNTLFKIPLPDDFKDKKAYIPLGDAITDLPFLKAGEGVNERVNYISTPVSEYQKFMRNPRELITGYDALIDREHKNTEGVYNHQCRNHNDLDIQRYAALEEGHIFTDLPHELRNGEMPENFKDKYRKLDSKKPSYTIVAHLYKDGNAFVHPDKKQARTLTVREAARIQTFPDDFFFCKSRTSQFKQVGNAVPPLLAYHIALAIGKMIDK
ncbi:MAG: DNA cytosine methyltransferase [Candidatus Mariimomonas ferrooxydans]